VGVDQTSLDRIRNATFPSSRRGYDKQEVEKFLARLADWLETGGGDESRSETVKRELERVGERTGAILSQAEDSAQAIRAEAEAEAQKTTSEADAYSEQTRSEADSYSEETRSEADAYAEKTRSEADAEAAEVRADADRDAKEAIADGEAQAARIVAEGTRRREDIESVIADLVRRRDEILADTEDLTGKLTAAVTEHRPEAGADPFDKPDEFDPEARDEAPLGDEPGDDEPVEVADDQDELFDVEAEAGNGGGSGPEDALDDEDLEPEDAADDGDTAEAPAKKSGRRSRGKARS
jgi:DivIVA domain-containing protein